MAGTSFDVLILGGGIAGATLAAHLAPRLRVAVLEREPALGHHATGRSAAMFLPSYAGPAVRPLTAASRRFLASPPRGFGGSLLTPRAAIWTSAEAASPDLSDRPGLRPLESGEARRRVPILRAEAARQAWLETDAADIDAARLHMGLLRLAREAGGAVHAGLDELAVRRKGRLWRVRAAEAAFEAPILVDAAGAWADEAAQAAGAAPLGLRPLQRTVVLVDPPTAPDFLRWPTVKALDDSFYFRPFAGRLLATPCDEIPAQPHDAQPSLLDVARAVQRLAQAADHPVRHVRHRWAGLRTFAPDRAPVFGWANDAAGFFWLAGLGGFGIQTAPAVGRLAAALLLGDPLPSELADFGIDPQAYAPSRFARAERARP